MAVVPTGGRSRDIAPYRSAPAPAAMPVDFAEGVGGFTLGDVLADPQHVIEDSNWSGVTQNLYEYQLARDFPYQVYRTIVTRARNFWRTYPLAKRSIELFCNYVLGEGVTIHCDQDDAQEWLEQFWNDQDNQRAMTGAIAQKRNLTFRQLDGELFIGLFPLADGRTKVRRIESLEISEVVPDPENDERVLHYQRWRIPKRFIPSPDGQTPGTWEGLDPEVTYLPDVNNPNLEGVPRIGTFAQSQVIRSGMRVYHSSIHALGKRGLSDLYAAFDAMDGQRTFIGDRLTLTHAWARLAWKRRIDAGPSVVARFAQAERSAISGAAGSAGGGGSVPMPGPAMGYDNNPPNQTAGTYFHNKATDMEPVEVNTGAPNAEVDNRIIVTHIGASVGIMLHYYGDAGDANLATATAQDHPMQKMFAMGQEEIKIMWQTIINFVLCRGIENGHIKGKIETDDGGTETAVLTGGAGDILKQRKSKAMRDAEPPKRVVVEIRFPKIVQRDTLPTTQAITAMQQAGGISQKDMAIEFANLLGVLDVDGFVDAALADKEAQQEQEQQQIMMQQQHELNLTNARTQGLTKPGGATSPPQRAGSSGPTRSTRMSEAQWDTFYTLFTEAGAAGGHWVTIENEEGETHIFISGGRITKGPHSLVGHNASVLSAHAESKGHKVTVHPQGHTPVGHANHPHYHEHQDKVLVHGHFGDGSGRLVDNPLPEKDDADVGKDYEAANQGKRDARATPAPGATDNDTTPRHGLRRVAAALRHHADTHYGASRAARYQQGPADETEAQFNERIRQDQLSAHPTTNDTSSEGLKRRAADYRKHGYTNRAEALDAQHERDYGAGGAGNIVAGKHAHLHDLADRADRLANDTDGKEFARQSMRNVAPGELPKEIHRDGPGTLRVNVEGHNYDDRVRQAVGELQAHHIDKGSLTQGRIKRDNGENTNLLRVSAKHFPEMAAALHDFHVTPQALEQLAESVEAHGDFVPHHHAPDKEAVKRHMQQNLGMGVKEAFQELSSTRAKAGEAHPSLEASTGDVDWLGDRGRAQIEQHAQEKAAKEHADKTASLESRARGLADHYEQSTKSGYNPLGWGDSAQIRSQLQDTMAEHYRHAGPEAHAAFAKASGITSHTVNSEADAKRAIESELAKQGLSPDKNSMEHVDERQTSHRDAIVKEDDPKLRKGTSRFEAAKSQPKARHGGFERAHDEVASKLEAAHSALDPAIHATMQGQRLKEDAEFHRTEAQRHRDAAKGIYDYQDDDASDRDLASRMSDHLASEMREHGLDHDHSEADIEQATNAVKAARLPHEQIAAMAQHFDKWGRPQDASGWGSAATHVGETIKGVVSRASSMAPTSQGERDAMYMTAHGLHGWAGTHGNQMPGKGDVAAFRQSAHDAVKYDMARTIAQELPGTSRERYAQRQFERGMQDQAAGLHSGRARFMLGSRPVDAAKSMIPGTEQRLIDSANQQSAEMYLKTRAGAQAGIDSLPAHTHALVSATGSKLLAHGNYAPDSGVPDLGWESAGVYRPPNEAHMANTTHVFRANEKDAQGVAAHEFFHNHDQALGRAQNGGRVTDQYGRSLGAHMGAGWRSDKQDFRDLYNKYRHDDRIPEYMRKNLIEMYAEGMAWHSGHSNFGMPAESLRQIAPDLHAKFDEIHRESEAAAHGRKPR